MVSRRPRRETLRRRTGRPAGEILPKTPRARPGRPGRVRRAGRLILAAVGLLAPAGPADVAVVLGNTVTPDGQPSPRLAARLDRAYDCYAAAQCRVLFVSGGVDAAGADEAAVMRDYLISRGVPADRIVADSAGVDTWAGPPRQRLHARAWLCPRAGRDAVFPCAAHHAGAQAPRRHAWAARIRPMPSRATCIRCCASWSPSPSMPLGRYSDASLNDRALPC